MTLILRSAKRVSKDEGGFGGANETSSFETRSFGSLLRMRFRFSSDKE
jgi:hypothetical protein